MHEAQNIYFDCGIAGLNTMLISNRVANERNNDGASNNVPFQVFPFLNGKGRSNIEGLSLTLQKSRR